jgi:PAS domain S-box-containing protein
MEAKITRVLLIEDNADDLELIKRKLSRSANNRYIVTTARKLQSGLEYLANDGIDVILSDLGLPDSHGLDTVTKILFGAPHVPLIILSGFDDEALAIKAVQAGAQDYLVKGHIEDSQMERSLAYAIERARLQRELEQHTQEIYSIQSNLYKILENNADAIVVVGMDRRILFANPAVELLLGRKQEELLYQPFDFPLSKDKKSEIEIIRPGGEKTVAEMNVVEIDWEGKPAYLASLRDITERKQAEQALRESEEKFSRAFRHSPEVIVISSFKDGTMLEVNDTFLRLTGYSRDEIIGKKSAELNIWANMEDRNAMINILRENGIVNKEEYQFRMKTGEIRTWLFSAEIINIGNEPCILSVTTDITERKKTVEALRFSNAAFNSIHEAVIAMDTDYVITSWNEISEQIYGIKASETIGKKLFDVIEVVETHPGENTRRIKALENNGYFREEELHRTKHGEVWVDVSVQAIEDKGRRYGWVALCSAITQRKLAEEALKRSEEKYRELISNSIDGIVSTDAKMRIIIWNQGAEKIFGYKEKEMLGQSIMKIIPEKDQKKMAKGFQYISKTGKRKVSSNVIEVMGMKKNGDKIPIELSISIRKSEDNYIITGIIRDITERKEAEEKLRQIDQMKSEFLSNVSHELRTPLQSISGFTKLILSGKVPDCDTQQEFLQIIDREAAHLGNIINSLLDMSRLESGRFRINKKLMPVRDIIIDSVKSFHTLAREKNIELTEDIPPQLPEMVIDSERIRQVVVNLISNAIKYSDPDGSVNVRVEKGKEALIIQVSDRGIGMSSKVLSHLFERFYRGDNEASRSGTGLGLYITKQIIEAHGGNIRVASKPGEGSTFSLTLPFHDKGGNEHGKEDTGHRRRPRYLKAG